MEAKTFPQDIVKKNPPILCFDPKADVSEEEPVGPDLNVWTFLKNWDSILNLWESVKKQ